jgi:hypothetical protein
MFEPRIPPTPPPPHTCDHAHCRQIESSLTAQSLRLESALQARISDLQLQLVQAYDAYEKSLDSSALRERELLDRLIALTNPPAARAIRDTAQPTVAPPAMARTPAAAMATASMARRTALGLGGAGGAGGISAGGISAPRLTSVDPAYRQPQFFSPTPPEPIEPVAE